MDRPAPTAAMRVVLFDDETMEPLTVLHLPSWMTGQLTAGDRMTLPIFRPLTTYTIKDDPGPVPTIDQDRVCIWFEKFYRRSEPHWFCFTRDGENSLLLRSVFLPGQRSAVNDEYKRGVRDGIVRALGAMLR